MIKNSQILTRKEGGEGKRKEGRRKKEREEDIVNIYIYTHMIGKGYLNILGSIWQDCLPSIDINTPNLLNNYIFFRVTLVPVY